MECCHGSIRGRLVLYTSWSTVQCSAVPGTGAQSLSFLSSIAYTVQVHRFSTTVLYSRINDRRVQYYTGTIQVLHRTYPVVVWRTISRSTEHNVWYMYLYNVPDHSTSCILGVPGTVVLENSSEDRVEG